MKSLPLSKVLEHPSKSNYVNSDQICLNFCDIDNLDYFPRNLLKIKKLLVSHNKISQLDGIEVLHYIENVSLAYNQISDINELEKIACKEKIKAIRLQGNPLDRIPDLYTRIIDIFPNVELINDTKINRKVLNKKSKLRKGLRIYTILLLFLLEKLFECNSQSFFGYFNEELVQKYAKKSMKVGNISGHQLFNYFFLHLRNELELILSKNFQEKLIKLADELFGGRNLTFRNQKESLEEIYKSLLKEILMRFSHSNNRILEGYLVELALKDPNNDLELFTSDKEYAFEKICQQFYRLGPIQAQINGIINYEDEDGNNKREVIEQEEDSFLIHFPIFIFNKPFMDVYSECIRQRIFLFLQRTQEFADSLSISNVPRLLSLEKEELVDYSNYQKKGATIYIKERNIDSSSKIKSPEEENPKCQEEQSEILEEEKKISALKSPKQKEEILPEEIGSSITKKKLMFTRNEESPSKRERRENEEREAKLEVQRKIVNEFLERLENVNNEVGNRIKQAFFHKVLFIKEVIENYETCERIISKLSFKSLISSLHTIAIRKIAIDGFCSKRKLKSLNSAFYKFSNACKISKTQDFLPFIRTYKQKILLGLSSYYLSKLKAYKVIKRWHRNQVQMLKFSFSKWRLINSAQSSLLRLGEIKTNRKNKENVGVAKTKFCTGNCLFRDCLPCKTFGSRLKKEIKY